MSCHGAKDEAGVVSTTDRASRKKGEHLLDPSIVQTFWPELAQIRSVCGEGGREGGRGGEGGGHSLARGLVYLFFCRRRGSAPPTAHQHWNVYDLKNPRTPLKKGETTPPAVANSHSKGGTRPPFDLLNFQKKKKDAHSRKEGTPSFRRRREMFKLCNKTNYSSEQALYSKETRPSLTNSLPSGP